MTLHTTRMHTFSTPHTPSIEATIDTPATAKFQLEKRLQKHYGGHANEPDDAATRVSIASAYMDAVTICCSNNLQDDQVELTIKRCSAWVSSKFALPKSDKTKIDTAINEGAWAARLVLFGDLRAKWMTLSPNNKADTRINIHGKRGLKEWPAVAFKFQAPATTAKAAGLRRAL